MPQRRETQVVQQTLAELRCRHGYAVQQLDAEPFRPRTWHLKSDLADAGKQFPHLAHNLLEAVVASVSYPVIDGRQSEAPVVLERESALVRNDSPGFPQFVGIEANIASATKPVVSRDTYDLAMGRLGLELLSQPESQIVSPIAPYLQDPRVLPTRPRDFQ